MPAYVGTARFFAAFPAFQVVCGVDAPTPGTGVVITGLPQPLFVPNGADPFQIVPEFYPVRSFRLKLYQVIAGILRAFNAEIDSPPGGADAHPAFRAVGPPLLRPASATPDRLLRNLVPRRDPLKPLRVLLRGDEQRTRLTIETAYSGQLGGTRFPKQETDPMILKLTAARRREPALNACYGRGAALRPGRRPTKLMEGLSLDKNVFCSVLHVVDNSVNW